jgi:hypothetical protein
VVIFPVPSTQRQESLELSMTNDKKIMWLYDIDLCKINAIDNFQLPDNSVPLDFDGQRLLWLKHKRYSE